MGLYDLHIIQSIIPLMKQVGEYRINHGLVEMFRYAYEQRIGARSITYNCEKCTPPRPQRNCGLHPLIHTQLKFGLAQDVVRG